MSRGETQHEEGMTNLVDKYGARWFTSKFSGAYFSHKGIPASVNDITNDSNVRVNLYPRVDNEVRSMSVVLPKEEFVDHKMFSVPELGYRHASNGKWLGFISRNNSSYNRGIGVNNIRTTESNLTRSIRRLGIQVQSPKASELCNMVIDPGFIPFHKGIALMLAGKIASFAASPTIAVVPTPEEDTFTIMMCSREVGTVSASGEINLVLPFAKNYIEETLCN